MDPAGFSVLHGPPAEEAELSSGTKIYATIIFLLTWLLIAPSKWPWFPLGRAAGAMVGAALMMIGGVIVFEDGMRAIGDNLEVRKKQCAHAGHHSGGDGHVDRKKRLTCTWLACAWGVIVLALRRVGSGLSDVDEVCGRLFNWTGKQVMALLFGLMVIANFLSREGLYGYLDRVFSYRCRGAFDLMARVVLVCGVLSAFITNDAVCIFITPLVVKLCRKYDLPGGPFLIALGTSANIGSAATITGNPQNALIAIKGNIGYLEFAKYMMPIAFLGLGINLGLLFLMYGRQLRGRHILAATQTGPHGIEQSGAVAMEPIEYARLRSEGNDADEEADTPGHADASALRQINAQDSHRATNDHTVAPDASGDAFQDDEIARSVEDGSSNNLAKAKSGAQAWRPPRRVGQAATLLTYLATLGVFITFFLGVPIGLASFAGCVVVLIVQGVLRRFEPAPVLAEVDYNLMLFFAGLFIAVEGFNRTGYPATIETALFSQIDLASAAGIAVFVVAVVLASNSLSNVPAVLLIAPFILTLPEHLQFAYWVMAAWVTTVGGNLTIIGSAANVIVAERAAAVNFYELSFKEFFYFGSWTTVLMILYGCIPLYLFLF